MAQSPLCSQTRLSASISEAYFGQCLMLVPSRCTRGWKKLEQAGYAKEYVRKHLTLLPIEAKAKSELAVSVPYSGPAIPPRWTGPD